MFSLTHGEPNACVSRQGKRAVTSEKAQPPLVGSTRCSAQASCAHTSDKPHALPSSRTGLTTHTSATHHPLHKSHRQHPVRGRTIIAVAPHTSWLGTRWLLWRQLETVAGSCLSMNKAANYPTAHSDPCCPPADQRPYSLYLRTKPTEPFCLKNRLTESCRTCTKCLATS